MDNGKYGLTFASGLGAQTAILQLLSAGDHIISCDDIYGGTNRLFNKVIARQGIEVDLIDATDLNVLKKALKPNTKVSYRIASSTRITDPSALLAAIQTTFSVRQLVYL